MPPQSGLTAQHRCPVSGHGFSRAARRYPSWPLGPVTFLVVDGSCHRQGLKPTFFRCGAARLKPCPDTKPVILNPAVAGATGPGLALAQEVIGKATATPGVGQALPPAGLDVEELAGGSACPTKETRASDFGRIQRSGWSGYFMTSR
jgi:hypothetical protein